MKESGKERLKQAIYESTLSTADAVPLPQWGKQIGGGFAANIYGAMPEGLLIVGFPRIVSLPLKGEGAPKGRIGHWRHEREREGASQIDDLRKHPIHR